MGGVDMVKSTVVIPNYNGIRYIEDCLDSLYAGTQTQFEVIMVDNASTDGSREFVQEKFPQVKLICNETNTGFSEAVNQGIQASTTPYVILLNNDTRADKAFIHELEKAIEKDVRIFSASAKLISLHDMTKLDDAGDYYCALGWAFARGKGKAPALYEKEDRIFAACGGAAIYRREYFERVGLFDVNHFAYLEDIDVGYRAQLCGYQNRFAPAAIVYHAGSATSGSRYNAFKTKLAARNSIYLIYKNMPLLQIIINLPFLLAGCLVKWLFFIRKGMGREYAAGVAEGFKLSASAKGRSQKVHFAPSRLMTYIRVQCALWCNIIRMLRK